jgi:hypothetical protein
VNVIRLGISIKGLAFRRNGLAALPKQSEWFIFGATIKKQVLAVYALLYLKFQPYGRTLGNPRLPMQGLCSTGRVWPCLPGLGLYAGRQVDFSCFVLCI